jgi:hypothetical protein
MAVPNRDSLNMSPEPENAGILLAAVYEAGKYLHKIIVGICIFERLLIVRAVIINYHRNTD